MKRVFAQPSVPQQARSSGRGIPHPALARRRFVRLVSDVPSRSLALPGLEAKLDKLAYHRGGASLPADKPHAFVYFVTIRNASEHTVTLLGRKWIIEETDGARIVIEGEKIVGETPRLAPGEHFSYNSYHVTGCEARACGCFHGIDERGRKVHALLAPFDLVIPSQPT